MDYRDLERLLKQLDRDFRGETRRLLSRHRAFSTKGEQRRRTLSGGTSDKKRVRGLINSITPSPLEYSFSNAHIPADFMRRSGQIQATLPAATSFFQPRIATEFGQLISVNVIVAFATKPIQFLVVKVERKGSRTFVGGKINPGESVLKTATREAQEETGPNHEGINIEPYNPIAIGSYTLSNALNGEQGAIVAVLLPAEAINWPKAGGGSEEPGEIISGVYFYTADQMDWLVGHRNDVPYGECLSHNSEEIWRIFRQSEIYSLFT